MKQAFGSYQDEIHLNGLAGMLPPFPIKHEELEAKAGSR
jgi:lactate 2-monooxygenase